MAKTPVEKAIKEEGITREEAVALLQKEKEALIKSAHEEVNAVLEKYNCILDVAVVLRKGSIEPMVNIIPKN